MRIHLRALGLTGAILAAPLAAQEQAPEPNTTATAAVAISASPFAVAPIEESTLRKLAGREDVNQVSQAVLAAGVSGNTVGDNAVTGDARISDNAFQNMSGLAILNVNTGNNVAINAAMNVNLSIQPGQ